jgi:hypothetical protein
MAEQRKGQRSKPAKVRATARAGAYKTPGNRSESSLKKECDRLRAELETARAEIAELKLRQAKVLDRIDWVLDSLDGLEEVGS